MNATHAEVMDRGGKARGLKRTADDTFDDDQRFAKRFNLLNLDHGSHDKLYIPVSARPQLQGLGQSAGDDEHMQLDDTKHRIYIHNLDDELADIESDEEKLVFLPDIEKKLNAIPRHLLTGNQLAESQELVLYDLPTSLSVPLEHDSVRKAILETRRRATEKAATQSPGSLASANGMPPEEQAETAHGYDSPDYTLDEDEEPDPDAMDIG